MSRDTRAYLRKVRPRRIASWTRPCRGYRVTRRGRTVYITCAVHGRMPVTLAAAAFYLQELRGPLSRFAVAATRPVRLRLAAQLELVLARARAAGLRWSSKGLLEATGGS